MEKTSKTRGIITFIIAIIAVIVMIATSGLLGLILYLFAVDRQSTRLNSSHP